MHGIVSLLPPPYYAEVEALWNELERDFGLRGVRVTPYPHFSWQIAAEYNEDRLAAALAEIAAESAPLVVRTGGLGIFPGQNPVLYVAVAKSPALARMHARVWARLAGTTPQASPLYHPEAWMPHISIGYGDLTPDILPALMSRLAFRAFRWEMVINNIGYIFEPDGSVGQLKMRYPFLR